jgi:hypothetical protein
MLMIVNGCPVIAAVASFVIMNKGPESLKIVVYQVHTHDDGELTRSGVRDFRIWHSASAGA